MWAGALHFFLVAALAAIFLTLALVARNETSRVWLVVGIAAGLVSWGGLFLRSFSVDSIPKDGAFQVKATITGDLSLKKGRVIGQSFRSESGSVPIRVTAIKKAEQQVGLRAPATLLTSAGFPELTPGTRISISVHAIPRIDELVLLKAVAQPVVIGRPGALSRGAQQIRVGLRKSALHLPSGFGGLLPGLVDGDTRYLPDQLNQQMRETNLTHLTAVSGANLALVAAFVIAILRWLRLPRRLQPPITALSIAGFVLIARPDPSVMRAAVMAGVLVLASVFEVPGLGLTSLIAAVTLLILFDPSQGQKPGFILSVLATAGILIFAIPWTSWLMRWLPHWLAQSLATPMAAQALCTPYLVVISGQLSLIGVWTNLLVAPAVAPATIIGFLTGLISPFSASLATLTAWVSAPPLWWISTVAKLGSQLSFSNLIWFGGWAGACFAALLICATFFVARRSPRTLFFSYLVLLLVVALLRAFTPGWPMSNWSIAMCDVGQGDGLVVRATAHSAVVIDAGPNPRLMDRCLKDLEIDEVPLVVLTHNHADHVEGLPGVLKHRKVSQIWLSPEIEPEFESARITKWAASIPISQVRLHHPFRTSLMEIEAWWPTVRINEGSIPNNASIVLTVRTHGRTALLLGDVESQAQERLLPVFSHGVDLLKVAHHGSANQSAALIKQLDPTIALISVGRINPYGHPSSATLARLIETGARVFRTDRDGSIAVALDTREIKVLKRGHPWWRQN